MADPATSALAAAAAAAASKFPTTLLLLFFVAPPAHVKQESQRVWTLQSTSQIETESPEMCVSMGTGIINDIQPVNTLTVRAYCLCPAGNGSDLCFYREKQKQQLESAIESQSAPSMPVPTVQRLGPKTQLPRSPSPPPRPGG